MLVRLGPVVLDQAHPLDEIVTQVIGDVLLEAEREKVVFARAAFKVVSDDVDAGRSRVVSFV